MSDKAEIAGDVLLAILLGFGAYLTFRFFYEFNEKFGNVGGVHGSPSPIDLSFAGKVVGALTTKLSLKPAAGGETGKIDRHRTFFIFRRARDLGIADPALRDGQGLETLKQRVEQQFNQVDAFVQRQLGTSTLRGAYFGGPSALQGDARHLDLGRYVSPRVSDPAPTTEADATQAVAPTVPQALTLRELDRRRMRVIGIVWRAAAIDPDVWKGAGSSATLQEVELTELLDRRLRSLERLQYEASAGATPSGIGSSFIEREWSSGNKPSTVAGPWTDNYTVRMFEAPSVPRTARSISPDSWVVQDFFATSQNTVVFAGFPRFTLGFLAGGPTAIGWFLNHMTNEFDWNDWPGTRMGRDATAATKTWGRIQVPAAAGMRDGYAWILRPVAGGTQAAEILRKLFVSSSDWWERAWLHPDGVLAALHLEALRHAKLRRTGTNNIFDSLPATYSLALDDYFEVRAQAVKTPNGIMRPGRTDYFENGPTAFDDLQLGDQVMFDTNPVLFVLGVSAWEYPTVLISDVDTTDISSGEPKVVLNRLRAQGFGTADLDYPSLQLLLAKGPDQALQTVRDEIQRQIQIRASAGLSAPTKLDWDSGAIVKSDDSVKNDSSLLRLWNPYGDTWDPPGPWWIWINLNAPMWRGALGNDVLKILGQVPNGIVLIAPDRLLPEFQGRVDAASTIPVGPGFVEPPWQDNAFEPAPSNPAQTIFVPLFEPDGGWIGYFGDKAQNPAVKYGPRLNPVISDGRWLPGLAKTADKIRVIRPRLKLAT